MIRRIAEGILPPLITLGLALALGQDMLAPSPDGWRLALALAVLVLSPGLAWRKAIGAPGPGAWITIGWALGYGIAWLGLGILLTRMVGLPFTVLVEAGAPWAVLPWLAAALLAPKKGPPAEGIGRAASVAIVLAATFAALHVARAGGPPITWLSDSPDHIGTIRRMLESGDAFPADAFFRDAGPAGVDPRKGLWHPIVALLCRLAQVDPLPAWRMLAAMLASVFVLNAATFGYRFGGGLGAAIAGWALVLTYGGGLGTPYLAEAVFSTKLADQLALATAAAMFADLHRRTTRSRLAVIGLAAGAVFVHVFAAIQFAIVFGALGAGLLLRDRGRSPMFARLMGTALLAALAALPYLGWRALHAYAPVNIIHTQPQGLLEILPGVKIVSFGALWDWLGPAGLLFPLSFFAWSRASRDPAALYLLTTTLAVLSLMFFPPLVAIVEPHLGYLLMRLPWLLPISGAAAFLVAHARDAWSLGQRTSALTAGAIVAVGLAAPLADGVRALIPPAAAQNVTPSTGLERWADALEWMERNLPAGTVVLSDPATSYSVPMLTRHWVTALVDQHSSPNDSLALTRILDARDALDPYASWTRTAEVVRRWGATVIVLNGRFDEPPTLDYWAPSASWYAAARERLERAPGAFERVYDQDHFTVYRIHPDVLEHLTGGAAPRPFVRDAGVDDVGRALGEDLPGLVSFKMGGRTEAALGDTLHGVIEWRTDHALEPGAYHIAVRFDRALPPDAPRAPVGISKIWRKFIEKSRGERYRFRADHLPAGGAYGVDRWTANEVVSDTFRLVVPHDVAPGDYAVKVSMARLPHYPNMALQDLLSDDDFLNGLDVAHLQIVQDRR